MNCPDCGHLRPCDCACASCRAVCPHTVVVVGACAECGADRSAIEDARDLEDGLTAMREFQADAVAAIPSAEVRRRLGITHEGLCESARVIRIVVELARCTHPTERVTQYASDVLWCEQCGAFDAPGGPPWKRSECGERAKRLDDEARLSGRDFARVGDDSGEAS